MNACLKMRNLELVALSESLTLWNQIWKKKIMIFEMRIAKIKAPMKS